MTDQQRIMFPRLHPAQHSVIDSQARFNVLACGRRWGKSTLGIERLLTPALDGYPVAYFTPTYKMLADTWRDVYTVVSPIALRINRVEHCIELATGGLIDMWSLDTPDVARGRRYRRVVIDESAMIRSLQDAWQSVIRPTLADYSGDAWALSTPKGHNFFHAMYRWGQDPFNDEWASWQMPTAANPFIQPAEIAAMQRELPEHIFAQEVLAQFVHDSNGLFRRLEHATTAVPQECALPDHRYVFGVDWGRQNDFTVISVLDKTIGHQVALDRFNRIDYEIQLSRLQTLYDRFRPQIIVAEQNAIGQPLIERLQRLGLPVRPFVTTNASKLNLIDDLTLAFERGAFRILPDPVQFAELQAFEMDRLPSGLVRFAAPSGLHDDCVMALALSYSAINYISPLDLACWV